MDRKVRWFRVGFVLLLALSLLAVGILGSCVQILAGELSALQRLASSFFFLCSVLESNKEQPVSLYFRRKLVKLIGIAVNRQFSFR